MTREIPLDWIGSSKRDLLAFPEPVINAMGYGLGVAQLGGKHPHAKPWKGASATDIALIKARLRLAREDYQARTATA